MFGHIKGSLGKPRSRGDQLAGDLRYLKAPVPHTFGGAAAGLRPGLFCGTPARGLSVWLCGPSPGAVGLLPRASSLHGLLRGTSPFGISGRGPRPASGWGSVGTAPETALGGGRDCKHLWEIQVPRLARGGALVWWVAGRGWRYWIK